MWHFMQGIYNKCFKWWKQKQKPNFYWKRFMEFEWNITHTQIHRECVQIHPISIPTEKNRLFRLKHISIEFNIIIIFLLFFFFFFSLVVAAIKWKFMNWISKIRKKKRPRYKNIIEFNNIWKNSYKSVATICVVDYFCFSSFIKFTLQTHTHFVHWALDRMQLHISFSVFNFSKRCGLIKRHIENMSEK